MKILIFFVLLHILSSNCDKKFNKYSKEANIRKEEQYDPDFRKIEKPFRMAKTNLVWTKAVHRLTEPKLKSLYYQLKIHDQEQLTHKQSKHLDKEGRIEAELRSKLINIMTQYGLLEHFHETDDKETLKSYKKKHSSEYKSDSYKNKSLFKDKKLNSLWEKAEVAGFSSEELESLKEEFIHHQDKVDVYYSLLDDVGKNIPKKGHESQESQYGLLEHFHETNGKETLKSYKKKHKSEYKSDSNKNKSLFKDKKANSLWKKAEVASEELKTSKEEFIHHQDKKADIYYSLLDDVGKNIPKKGHESPESQYGLLEHFHETDGKETLKSYKKKHKSEYKSDSSKNKDKKVNSLWKKAEVADFSSEELKTLKEEFIQHQDKVDVNYLLLDDVGKKGHENAINEDELEDFNEIDHKAEDITNAVYQKNSNDIHTQNINDLRDHHRGIKDSIDRLDRVVSRGPNSKDFIEPRVQALWKDALNTSFSEEELESLRDELQHYEARLLKLRHLHAEHALTKEKQKNKKVKDKSDSLQDMEDHIKKQQRKAEKLHQLIEDKIFQHNEL